MKINEKELKYLKVLSKQYPSISKASTEIINLEAILNLPKGTEHFISDIHGEYEPFVHVLKNGSGVIKRKIEELFSSTIRESEKNTLATLVSAILTSFTVTAQLAVLVASALLVTVTVASPALIPFA